jgi:hypothetical protein
VSAGCGPSHGVVKHIKEPTGAILGQRALCSRYTQVGLVLHLHTIFGGCCSSSCVMWVAFFIILHCNRLGLHDVNKQRDTVVQALRCTLQAGPTAKSRLCFCLFPSEKFFNTQGFSILENLCGVMGSVSQAWSITRLHFVQLIIFGDVMCRPSKRRL